MVKAIARTDDRDNRRLISIMEVSENHDRWRGRTFYPVVGTEPMYARVNVATPHFYYASEKAGSGGGEGEGIVHELAKLVISETRELRIHFKDKILLHLRFSDVQAEVPFEHRKVTYRIDLVGTLVAPADLVQRWGTELFIEILVAHKTEEHKVKALRRGGRTTIEVKVHDDWKVNDRALLTEAELEGIKAGIQSRFQRSVFAWYLHNPNWREEAAARDPAPPHPVLPVAPKPAPPPPPPPAVESWPSSPCPEQEQALPIPPQSVDQPVPEPRKLLKRGLFAEVIAWVRGLRG
jgi:hypothetical protein